eukprot:CAMPEP_0202363358 /NCGR_PEP_ID=MMETSP1126-20121109/15188_1 /ASSEMBLY_ACC=CAM_ASM_000457 /TAXON_ID=3047 /ORGANISM="Dunaliella tertiolecta, Strain CCMP1320" /LENGTH=89 /DNA_ID=CAMNT_0048957765 /DNA_START=51 /DNA_END=316 /DNA_ORIENTATION=-
MASNVYGITNVLPPLAPPAAALPAACRFCLPASALNKPFNSFLDARLARRNSFTAFLRARRSSALSPFWRAVVAMENATEAASSPPLSL